MKLDPLTATASFVGKTNGFLTGPSSRPRPTIGLDYVKANAAALGLTAERRRGARAEPRLRRHPRHPPPELRAEGERSHGLRQRRQGQRRQGRPHHQRDRLARRLTRWRTRGDAGDHARPRPSLAAKQNVGAAAAPAATTSNDDLTTNFSSGDATKLVYFKTLNGLTLAYRTLLVNDGYLIVVDAASGKVLYRDSFKDSANGLAFDNRPGAAAGGTQHSFDVNGPGGSWNFGAFNPARRDGRRPLEQQRLGVQRHQ